MDNLKYANAIFDCFVEELRIAVRTDIVSDNHPMMSAEGGLEKTIALYHGQTEVVEKEAKECLDDALKALDTMGKAMQWSERFINMMKAKTVAVYHNALSKYHDKVMREMAQLQDYIWDEVW